MQSISMSPQNCLVRIRYGAQSHRNKVADFGLSLALMTPSSVISLARYITRILVKKCITVVLTEGDLAVSP